MKNFLQTSVLALVLFSGSAVSAQTVNTTTLNVTLTSLFQITVGQVAVPIAMLTLNNYKNGSESGVMPAHLVVNATGGYNVQVSASTDLKNATDGTTIPVNTITVKPAYGLLNFTQPVKEIIFSPLPLSTSPQTIISSLDGETIRTFDVNYVIPVLMAPYYMNKSLGIYTTTLAYTLVAL